MSQKRTNLESPLSVSLATSTRRIRKASGLMALEPRFMFDGAGAVDAVDKTVQLSLTAPTASGLTAATVAAQSDAERMVATFLSGTNAREQSFQLFNGGQTGAQPSAEWLASFQQLLDNVTHGQVNVKVELLSNTEMQGAKGAFSATGSSGQATIYLNAEWLARADRESISRVMVEEMGHFLDATLNDGADTAGDEGEMFSRVVFDGSNPLAVSYLSAQDDHAVFDP